MPIAVPKPRPRIELRSEQGHWRWRLITKTGAVSKTKVMDGHRTRWFYAANDARKTLADLDEVPMFRVNTDGSHTFVSDEDIRLHRRNR